MADGTVGEVKSSVETRLEIPDVVGFEVVSLHIREAVSDRTRAVIEISSTEDLELGSKLLAACTVAIEEIESATKAALRSRRWTLKLGEARFVEHKDNAFRYALSLHDSLWPLSMALDTRKFRNMSANQIVSKILDEAGIKHEFRLSGELPQRKYTAQYRETKLAFIERLMEFEGVHYFQEPDGNVVFSDASASAERVDGGRAIDLIEAAGAMSRNEVGVHELRKGRVMTTGLVSLGDYNWKKPDLDLYQIGRGDGDQQLERYEFYAGYREPGQGARLAQLRTEAHRVRARYLAGKGNVTAFAPGLGVVIGGSTAAVFSGEFFLTELEHVSKAGAFSDGTSPGKGVKDPNELASLYENRFKAIPLAQPFRPFVKTPRPTVGGSHTAMVRGPGGEEIHTDQYGRFKAQMHWDREAKESDEDSRWLRLTQETSSSMVIARTGWEMMVGYIGGDPDRPIGLGRSINGQMTPQYGQPANKNMMSITTPSSPATGGYSEIKMDDTAGSQLMAFRAEKDLDAVIKNDKKEEVGRDETHEVTNDFKREINGDQYVTIGANDTATYDATSELKVKGNRSLKVGGSEKVDIGSTLKNTATKGETEKVGSARLNIVGSIKIPDFKKMAKQALDGLNPLPAIKQALKNPFDGLLGELKKEVKGLEDIIKDPSKLLTGENGITKALEKKGQEIGKGILDDAYKKAKEAYDKNGLGAAAGAGWDALGDGAKKAFENLPDTVKNTALESLQKSVGGQVKELMTLGGIVKLPDDFKLEGPGGLLPSTEQLKQLYSSDALAKSVEGYLQTKIGGQVSSLLTLGGYVPLPKDFKLEGYGGFLPSVDQLKQLYSVDNLTKGITAKLEGALNTATGGLFDSFFPKGQNGQREFKLGWDQIDKLIEMFTTGGISKTAEKAIQVLVGGASIKAALGPISWGAKVAWLETIGGVKYTRTPVQIDQDVKKVLQLTVLGKAFRGADKTITIDAGEESTVKVSATSTYDGKTSVEIEGKKSVQVTVDGEIKFAGGGASKLKLTQNSVVFDAPKVGVNGKNITIKGTPLKIA
ncbi:MAG: type VI secretion system tip protein TssI/VgrG [Polyangiaceae bacterium]